MSHIVSESELEVALDGLPGWTVEENYLSKTYLLPSFRDAVAALVRISFEAEDVNHHPELRLSYSSLEVRLCTHDAGDIITNKDLSLATKIETLISKV